MTTVWTIGYEWLLSPGAGRGAQGRPRIERVIDVRFRPNHAGPACPRRGLGELLADHRIAYESRRALGTPPDIRWLFKAHRLDEARAAYRRHVEQFQAHELDALAAELAHGPRTALLCLEAEPARAIGASSPKRSRHAVRGLS